MERMNLTNFRDWLVGVGLILLVTLMGVWTMWLLFQDPKTTDIVPTFDTPVVEAPRTDQ